MFNEQLSLEFFTPAIFYLVGGASIVLAILGIMLIIAGLTRRKFVLSQAIIPSIVSVIILGLAYATIGYGIWVAQIYEALGIPKPWLNAILDWSQLFGKGYLAPAQYLDPKFFPEADVLQVFGLFNLTFVMIIGLCIVKSCIERVKHLALYLYVAVFGLIVTPVILYGWWGPTGWFGNMGVHDYFGALPFHMNVGIWSLVLAWRLGPRLDVKRGKLGYGVTAPHNLAYVAIGTLLLLFSLTLIYPGATFIYVGKHVLGITGATTGLGLLVNNLWAAFLGGGIAGVILGYITKNPIYVITGPAMGFIANTATGDVVKPYINFLVAFVGPWLVHLGYKLVAKLKIDDPGGFPFHFLPGLWSALVVGFLAWGRHQGGYPGGIAGYEFQHAVINPITQIIGIIALIAFSLVTALITVYIIEKLVGLRVSEKEEEEGTDKSWLIPCYAMDIDENNTTSTTRSKEAV